MVSPFSQSQDWKYQCGTREALPSAQCMALLETNVVQRRIVNLYTLSLRNTSMLVQHRNSSQSKKNLSCIVCVIQLRTGRKKKQSREYFLEIYYFFLYFPHT